MGTCTIIILSRRENNTEVANMRTFDLGNGHTLIVEKANRGIEDDYKVTELEDNVALFGSDYYSKDALEFDYNISL